MVSRRQVQRDNNIGDGTAGVAETRHHLVVDANHHRVRGPEMEGILTLHGCGEEAHDLGVERLVDPVVQTWPVMDLLDVVALCEVERLGNSHACVDRLEEIHERKEEGLASKGLVVAN